MNDLPPIDGVFLKNIRKKRGWTQIELADFLGCSQARISRFERCEAPIGRPYQKLLLALIIAPPESRASA